MSLSKVYECTAHAHATDVYVFLVVVVVTFVVNSIFSYNEFFSCHSCIVYADNWICFYI